MAGAHVVPVFGVKKSLKSTVWDCCKNGQRSLAQSITALCGCGMGCPESRDSSEQEAEGAELGELREQEK